MIINRKIRIKAIVTPDFKSSLMEEVAEGLKKIEVELNILDQRAKKTMTELTLKASPNAQLVREQLEWEKKKREDARTSLKEQLKAIAELKEETEVIQGEIEGPCEIKVGDSWDAIFSKEIVLKDGIVVDIR